MFFFLSIKNTIFNLKELYLLNKSLVVFLEKNTKVENYVFYKVLFQDKPYFFYYSILKLLSDFLIKI